MSCFQDNSATIKTEANKGFLAIGAKARLSQNPDVGHKKMNAGYIIVLWGLFPALALAEAQVIIPYNSQPSGQYSPPEYWEQYPSKQPPIEMQAAYEKAKFTLAAFNQDTYCLESRLNMRWTGTPGESVPQWWFRFGTTTDDIIFYVWIEATGEASLHMIKPDKNGVMQPYKPQDWLPKTKELGQQGGPGYPPQGVGSPDP